MSDSFLDHIPSQEREKIRKRMRSPEAYEALREKVKGPEDLARELDRSETFAEAHFAIESEPHMLRALKQSVEQALRENPEQVLEGGIDAATKKALLEGRFTVHIGPHPQEHHDAVLVVPEGNVHEALPVTLRLSDQFVASLLARG